MLNQRQTALVSLLLGSFPSFQTGDAEAAFAAYQFVLRDIDDRDLEHGVGMIVNGLLPGHDMRFAPTAPQLATAIRINRDKRLDSERRAQLALPAPPVQEVSEEERARVKAKFEALLAEVKHQEVLDHEDHVAKQRERFREVNKRFDPPQDDESLTDRLHLKRGADYTAGAPESDDAAA